MRRNHVLVFLLALAAAISTAADDDISEFLEVVADARAAVKTPVENDDNDNASDVPAVIADDASERIGKHLGLGFAEGFSDDASGEASDNCSANGHSGGYIDGSGYRDCGDPSPSD